MEIELGDAVRDKVSGFKGIATSKTEFLNGCIQYDVIPKVGKDNKIPEGVAIDENSLEIIKKKSKPRAKKEKEESNGGPNHSSVRMRGY